MKYKFLAKSGKLSDWGDPPEFMFRPGGSLLSIPENVLELMPESVARENGCLPLRCEGETLHVAHYKFDDLLLQDKLRFLLNRNIVFHLWPKDEISHLIDQLYGQVQGESADSMLEEFTDTAIDFTDTENIRELVNGANETTGDLSQQQDSDPRNRQSIGKITRTLACNTPSPKTPGDGMFFYTIEEGRKALVYRIGGRIQVVDGPARLWKGFSRFKEMKHFVAHPGEFLVIRCLDGTQQHLKGPAQIWFDPRIHEEIRVQEGLTLAAKEAVVVYGEDEQAQTQRRICYGPGLFVPQPGEWLHEFSWHASQGGSRGVEKVPNGLKFQKMWLMPDQMYHDVSDVRTSDDAVLVIRLMIFFELLDIERMLDTTHDPIGDFINAATSDVVEFTGKFSFEDFKKQTEHLNELSTYSQLLHRAEQCGYRINNVVYRGYGAPKSLQKMHDEAIAARTSLQLEKDTEKQTQELEDYRLQCQVERSDRRRVEQTTEVEHDLLLQEKKRTAELEIAKRQQDVKRDQRRQDSELQNELARQHDADRRTHLEQLKAMGVELTEYLTQGRADQVIELRGKNGSQQPHLHLSQTQKAKEKLKVS